MKKLLKVVLAALMVLSLVACGGGETATDDPETFKWNGSDDDVTKIIVLVPKLGDASYFDTLDRGAKMAGQIDGVEIEVKEIDKDGSKDESLWMGAFAEYCEDGEYDLVVSGNDDYEEFLYKACEKYPTQRFYCFDYNNYPVEGVEPYKNLYAVNYNCAELGYVVAAVMAEVTQTKKVGAVVGLDIQAMNYFCSGWCQYLQEKGIEYEIAYPGKFDKPDLGYSAAETLAKDGCDVIWGVAGQTGNGVIQFCDENNIWAIGVDADQYAQFAESNPTWADSILTSALKSSDLALVKYVQELKDGTFDKHLGTYGPIGCADNGVGIVENDFFKANTTEEQRANITAAINEVVNGTKEVINCFAWSADEYATKWPELYKKGAIVK